MKKDSLPLDLSLCMIAKNEEEFLDRHLPVVAPLASEFIYVDTGSADKSITIAKKYTSKIFFKEWESDFAKVRNFALKKASKKWILVLDADEVISPRDFPLISSALKNHPGVGGFIFRQRSYLLDPDDENFIVNRTDYEEGKEFRGYMDVSVVRIFENKPSVHYTGAAHDMVEYSIAERPKIDLKIPIHHYGMARSREKIKEKDEEYLRQLKKDVENHPEIFKTRFTLGRHLYRLCRFQEAEEELLKAIDIRPSSDTAFLNLSMAVLEQGKIKEAEKSIKKSLEYNAVNPEAWNILGVIKVRENDLKKSEELFRNACRINPESPKFNCNLSSSLISQGKYEEAESIVAKILERFHDYVPALVNHLKILVCKKKYPQAVEVSKVILRLNKDFAATVKDILTKIKTS